MPKEPPVIDGEKMPDRGLQRGDFYIPIYAPSPGYYYAGAVVLGKAAALKELNDSHISPCEAIVKVELPFGGAARFEDREVGHDRD